MTIVCMYTDYTDRLKSPKIDLRTLRWHGNNGILLQMCSFLFPTWSARILLTHGNAPSLSICCLQVHGLMSSQQGQCHWVQGYSRYFTYLRRTAMTSHYSGTRKFPEIHFGVLEPCLRENINSGSIIGNTCGMFMIFFYLFYFLVYLVFDLWIFD